MGKYNNARNTQGHNYQEIIVPMNKAHVYEPFGWVEVPAASYATAPNTKSATVVLRRFNRYAMNSKLRALEDEYVKRSKKKYRQLPILGIITFILTLAFFAVALVELFFGIKAIVNKKSAVTLGEGETATTEYVDKKIDYTTAANFFDTLDNLKYDYVDKYLNHRFENDKIFINDSSFVTEATNDDGETIEGAFVISKDGEIDKFLIGYKPLVDEEGNEVAGSYATWKNTAEDGSEIDTGKRIFSTIPVTDAEGNTVKVSVTEGTKVYEYKIYGKSSTESEGTVLTLYYVRVKGENTLIDLPGLFNIDILSTEIILGAVALILFILCLVFFVEIAKKKSKRRKNAERLVEIEDEAREIVSEMKQRYPELLSRGERRRQAWMELISGAIAMARQSEGYSNDYDEDDDY